MSNVGVSYKRAVDLEELSAIPADGDFFVIVDISDANREKKISASRIVSSTGINLADTTTSTTGVITKALTRFIHNFHHPVGGGAIPLGLNTFIGLSSGNFTTGATATSTFHSSKNVGVGDGTLTAIAKGFRNVAFGHESLNDTTDANDNSAFGSGTLPVNISGDGCTAIGSGALATNISGDNNIALGADAGGDDSLFNNNETGSNSIYIGNSAYPLNDAETNQIVIGHSVVGLGSNTIVIGNDSIVSTTLKGTVKVKELNSVSFENATVYFEGNAVFN